MGCMANARFDLSGKPAEPAPSAAPAATTTPSSVPNDVMGWNAQRPASLDSTEREVVVVREGDTLYSLAQRHGVTVDMIYATNGLRNDYLTPGQHLIIPSANRQPVLAAPAADIY